MAKPKVLNIDGDYFVEIKTKGEVKHIPIDDFIIKYHNIMLVSGRIVSLEKLIKECRDDILSKSGLKH